MFGESLDAAEAEAEVLVVAPAERITVLCRIGRNDHKSAHLLR